MFIYDEIKTAFDYYNKNLFNNELPECVLTLTRQAKTKGYFINDKFINNTDKKHEISLNPEYFLEKNTQKILSTLVHEMCHLKMVHIGHSSKSGYHDKKWAEEMKNIGLIPSTTGKPGGQETGYAVSHYIQKNGNFEIFTNKLLNQGFQFNWKESTIKYEIIEKNQITNEFLQNIQENKRIIEINDNEVAIIEKEIKTKSGKRIKYSCGCSNIWGKNGLQIKCNLCNQDFIQIK